jgi:hypothetical protein
LITWIKIVTDPYNPETFQFQIPLRIIDTCLTALCLKKEVSSFSHFLLEVQILTGGYSTEQSDVDPAGSQNSAAFE